MKITSNGTAKGTHVLNDDGTKVDFGNSYLVGIDFDPIRADGLVTARLIFDCVDLDITLPEGK